MESGGWLLCEVAGKSAQEIMREPHIVGVTREMDSGRPGSWVGTLFDYNPPQILFSRGQQRLLLSALSGGGTISGSPIRKVLSAHVLPTSARPTLDRVGPSFGLEAAGDERGSTYNVGWRFNP
jgi:hypothetical protein